jgi:hypothetical protein
VPIRTLGAIARQMPALRSLSTTLIPFDLLEKSASIHDWHFGVAGDVIRGPKIGTFPCLTHLHVALTLECLAWLFDPVSNNMPVLESLHLGFVAPPVQTACRFRTLPPSVRSLQLDFVGNHGDSLVVNISPQPELRRLVMTTTQNAAIMVYWRSSAPPKLQYLEVVGDVANASDLLQLRMPELKTARFDLVLDELMTLMEHALPGLKSVSCLEIIDPSPGLEDCAGILNKLGCLQELQLPWISSELGDLVLNPVVGIKVTQVNSDNTTRLALAAMCLFAEDLPLVVHAKVGRTGRAMPIKQLRELLAQVEDDEMHRESSLVLDPATSSWRWVRPSQLPLH